MNKQPGIFRASTLAITLLTASSTLLAPLPTIVSADNGADTTTATQTTKNTVNYDELNNTISQLNLSKAQKAAGLNVSKYADNPAKLAQMVKQYTTDTLNTFKKSGIKVGMVQVGNEFTSHSKSGS
ncbi:hypothetical protein JOC59_000058 [Weissella beninensis]|uniref:Arabinogalactan endo-beta-1,4-galactanase n=1 Tax=Periweissella beninensis TaxID=504936 RepID=A0ABT0VI58_9LACO|nr:glycosyl hydrolase 53 family protein [Periweissella beninensis]MBM7543362.1 hypothetical protein [Periweissella beninensis]MCM2437341.1 glycosyl hydrolase 53 family protein [Periweissella beninensis]